MENSRENRKVMIDDVDIFEYNMTLAISLQVFL